MSTLLKSIQQFLNLKFLLLRLSIYVTFLQWNVFFLVPLCQLPMSPLPITIVKCQWRRIFSQESPAQTPRMSGGEVTLTIPRSYGAIGGIEKVTYTWADINAFATENRSRSRRFWNFWKTSSHRMFQQRKQLLKSGKLFYNNRTIDKLYRWQGMNLAKVQIILQTA